MGIQQTEPAFETTAEQPRVTARSAAVEYSAPMPGLTRLRHVVDRLNTDLSEVSAV
jgi:hypothetical protein